ncbi:MAG: HAD family hydrolase [Rhizobiaceae bacterium]
MSIRAVLWDMDGTLVDSEPTHIAALAEAMSVSGIQIPDDLEEHVTGMSADAVHQWLSVEHGLSLSFKEWIRMKYSRYAELIDNVVAFEGALDLWHRLSDAGIHQAIVSNSDRWIVNLNLEQIGLQEPRLLTVSRNDVRQGKPDPEPYLRAAYLLGIEPRDAIVLEDSPPGAKAGIAAGMQTYFVPFSPLCKPENIERLNSYEEVAELCRVPEFGV